jgi:hypothetical protein
MTGIRALPPYDKWTLGDQMYIFEISERFYKLRAAERGLREGAKRHAKKRQERKDEHWEQLRIFLDHHGLRQEYAQYLQCVRRKYYAGSPRFRPNEARDGRNTPFFIRPKEEEE